MCPSLQCYFPFYATLHSLLLAYQILNTTPPYDCLALSLPYTHNCTTLCFLHNPFNSPIICPYHHPSYMINPLLTFSYKILPLFVSYVNKTYSFYTPFLRCSTRSYMYYNTSHITLPHHYRPNSLFTYLYYSY